MSPSRKRGEKSLTRLTNELSHGEGKEQTQEKNRISWKAHSSIAICKSMHIKVDGLITNVFKWIINQATKFTWFTVQPQ